MTRDTIYAILAVGVAVVAGILVGLGFITVASIFYSLHYGAC
jgi:hypothetical protein